MRKRVINKKSLRRIKRYRIFDELLKFEKTWLLVPFIFYAAGFFIHNSYLSKFSTFDLEIIQTKYVYVGFLFAFYLCLFILFLVIGIGYKKNSPDSIFLKVSAWLIRLPLLAVLIHLVIYPPDVRVSNVTYIVDGNIFLIILFSFTAFTLFVYFFWLLFYCFIDFVSYPKVDRAFKIYFAISLIPIYFTLYLYNKQDQHFGEIVNFITTPFLLLFVSILILLHISKTKYYDKSKIFVNTIGSLLFSFILFFLMISYSKNIYPNIPSNFGGAKPTYAIIYTEKDTINGKIYNENSEWLLINKYGSHSYKRIRVNSIKSITVSEFPFLKAGKPKGVE